MFAVLLVATAFSVTVLWVVGSAIGLIAPAAGLGNLGGAAIAVLAITGVVGLLASVRIATGIGRPLGDIIEAAGRVESGDYSARVAERRGGPRELQGLARAFNTMTARLERDETNRRKLLADVSHELRTPLAVIQGHVEALVDGIYPADEAHLTPVLDEVRVMGRLVDDLRTIALAESGSLPLHREPSDVGVLVGETTTAFAATAEAEGVRIAADVAEDLPLVDVDPIRIREVIGNLVANALRYSPRGGSVRVSVAQSPASPDGVGPTSPDALGQGDIVVAVSDDGPGIEPRLLAHVFDRFAKSVESRGSGLGLAIARAIVEAHAGTIRADSRVGEGTTIEFRIPSRGDDDR